MNIMRARHTKALLNKMEEKPLNSVFAEAKLTDNKDWMRWSGCSNNVSWYTYSKT